MLGKTYGDVFIVFDEQNSDFRFFYHVFSRVFFMFFIVFFLTCFFPFISSCFLRFFLLVIARKGLRTIF